MKIKNKIFLWPYGEFSDIKLSNHKFLKTIFVCNIFCKWKRSDLRWVVGSIPILILPNIQCIWSNGALKGSIENSVH